jgi:hypothetical protein
MAPRPRTGIAIEMIEECVTGSTFGISFREQRGMQWSIHDPGECLRCLDQENIVFTGSIVAQLLSQLVVDTAYG